MRRKLLKQMEPAKLTTQGKRFAVEPLLREIDGRKILELDIFKEKLPHGEKEMICRHFLDKEKDEFDTLFTKNQDFDNKMYAKGEWAKMKLVTVFSNGDYSGYNYMSEKDVAVGNKKIINDYLGIGDYDSIRNVELTESEIASIKNQNAYTKKIARIEKRMEQVEPLEREKFNQWMKSVVFPERYIFAETRELKRGYRCRCAECGKTFMVAEKPKHNAEMACKKCGTRAIVKTRTQQVEEIKAVLVVQQYDEKRWLTRHFKFRRISGTTLKKTGSKIEELEKARIFIKTGTADTEKVFYGQNNNYGNDEFTQEWWDTRGYSGMTLDKSFFIHPAHLQDIDMPASLKSTLMAAAAAGEKMDYNMLIQSYKYHPYIEYLIKGRYYNLARHIVDKYGVWASPKKLLNIRADNIPELLRLDAQRANRLRDMDGGRYALELLQMEQRDGVKITQENLEFAETHKTTIDDLQIERTRMTANRALNYIRRQIERNGQSYKSICQFYNDYLNMAEQRGADITDDIIRADPRMIERHMTYLEELNRAKDEKRIRELRKEFPNIEKDYVENAEMMQWEGDDYSVIVPRNAGDIVDEGKRQHHCVAASNQYFEKMNRRETFILFLRRQETRDTPYYTLEVSIKGGKVTVLQKYSAYDRQPNIDEVNKVLTAWKRDIEARLKRDDRIRVKAS